MSRRTFNRVQCSWDFVFKTWIGGETASNQWCSQPLFTGDQRETIGSIIVIGRTLSKPTAGSFDLMLFYKDDTGAFKYPGERKQVGFNAISEYNDYGQRKGTPNLCFSVVFDIPQPFRCDGFLFYNALDVSVIDIQAAYVPFIAQVSELELKGEQ